MEKHNFRRFINLETLITLMWGIFIISLPFNSFPHLPAALGGKAVVRPMVIFPLVGILITVVFPKIFTERLPATIIPLMIFVLVAVGGSVFALFRGIDPFREVTALDRLIRSVFTLVLGAAVYLGVVFVLVRQRNLKFTLKLVYLSAAIAFGIGSLQAIYVVTRSETWFSMMSVFQRIFSIRKLFIDRVSGPTYEPNWFSDQIMLVFVPFLLAALITGYSISTKRFLRLSLEGWLLLWALINLVMTFSRGGLAVLVPTVILGLVFYWWMGQNQAGYSKRQKIESLIKIAGIGILILVVLASAVYYFGQDNKFIRQIWDWKQGKVEVDSLADYFFILGID
ncbi:MAG: hypothetical protein OEZ01_12595, partial [Candidatus Heimdallarchaeota archaeon]|nr:hypothetical protein [Candidatus Heimdallarchaeota archaeon]